MYIKRSIENVLIKMAKEYPVVTINGPRQSGKTTLVKTLFADKPYINLELPDIRERVTNDPRGFLNAYKATGAIIDEIQRLPALLSYIQVDVDENNIPGKFILTGSNQGELHQAISQSLAGRTAILTLLPLSMGELKAQNIQYNVNEYLLQGFFPRIYSDKQTPLFLYRNYTQTYLEKDVRQIINIQNIDKFQRFLKLCAGRVGCVINKDSLANELGITAITVTNWLSILQASYIIFLLPPYFENFNKRVSKTPKLYFTDVGLVTYLLGIEDLSQLDRDPLRGFLFENLVIAELLKNRLNQGLGAELYYYRDNNQNEVDIIFKKGNILVPIEVKLSRTFNSNFLKGLSFYQNLVGERSEKQFLVYTGDDEYYIKSAQIINFKNVEKIIYQ